MTALISRDFIQTLLSKIDLVDLIDQRVPLRKKTGSNYFACCPFHTEKSPSFSVSQTKQFYYCFGCGARGNAIDFLIQYDRLSFPESVETLARQIGLEIPKKTSAYEPGATKEAYDLLANIARFYQQQLKHAPHAIEYLKKRGLSGLIAKQFEVGFANASWNQILQTFGSTEPAKKQLSELGMIIKKDQGDYYDRFRDRIMFPIRDRRGRVIGFGGRILDKGEPKYLNSPETPVFQKGRELYGLYQALLANRTLSRVLLVEGYMDVIALFQQNITYAVATLGTATTANHLQRLFRYCSDIIFCFDGDNAGRSAAWRALLVALPAIPAEVQIRFMFLPEGEDPDSLVRKEGKEQFEQRIQTALPLSHFFFQTLAAQVDLSHMDGRARFIKLATEHLGQLPEGIFKQMMYDELAKRARVDITQIQSKHLSRTPTQSQPIPRASRSLLRLALTLLVQEPKLGQWIDNSLLSDQAQGIDLINKISQIVKKNPEITTGALLEHFRETQEGQWMAQLAQTELIIPPAGLEAEFRGTLNQLYKLSRQQIIDRLLTKVAQDNIAAEEKALLHDLIHNKN